MSTETNAPEINDAALVEDPEFIERLAEVVYHAFGAVLPSDDNDDMTDEEWEEWGGSCVPWSMYVEKNWSTYFDDKPAADDYRGVAQCVVKAAYPYIAAEVRRQVLAEADEMISSEAICVVWEDGDNRPARGYETFADLLDAFMEDAK